MSRIAKLIVIVIVLAMAGCSYENTATVTIDTGIRKQAQLSLLDKVIAWFSLSKAVQADQPPAEVSFEELTLTVSTSDMSAITQTYGYSDIINNHGKITLEIPAGSQRTFEIVASRREMTGSFFPRYYGGIKTVDLSPGQNVDLDIQMGELPFEVYLTFLNYGFGVVYNNPSKFSKIIKIELFESVDDQIFIFKVNLDKNNFTYDETYKNFYLVLESLVKMDYYYKIKLFNQYGYAESLSTRYNP